MGTVVAETSAVVEVVVVLLEVVTPEVEEKPLHNTSESSIITSPGNVGTLGAADDVKALDVVGAKALVATFGLGEGDWKVVLILQVGTNK